MRQEAVFDAEGRRLCHICRERPAQPAPTRKRWFICSRCRGRGESNRRYRRSEKGRAAAHRYKTSAKGHKVDARYEATRKGSERRRRQNARRVFADGGYLALLPTLDSAYHVRALIRDFKDKQRAATATFREELNHATQQG